MGKVSKVGRKKHLKMESITLKPIEIFFCNVNNDMNLKGHCHYAEVILEFQTVGKIGFPSFKDTFNEIMDFVQNLKLKGFKGTNEDLLRYIHDEVSRKKLQTTANYKGNYSLLSTTLKVMGVQDENNHSNGFTTYKKW